MPKIDVFDMAGNVVSQMDISDAIFGIKPNKDVLHMAVVNYLNNQRQGTQSTLTRSEVRGGGRKPWKQKGTGHARQGSIRSPQWKHGGIALGPKPRDYSSSLNKKVKRLAMFSALSSKVLEKEIIVVDNLAVDEIKTKTIISMLSSLNADKKTLIVTESTDKNIYMSSRNIPGTKAAHAGSLNVYDILNCNSFVISKEAIAKLEEVYA